MAAMKTSTDRILTTHVGSLPRPPALLELIAAKEQGRDVDEAEFDKHATQAVEEVVAKQLAAGIDIVSDGEMSKPSYTLYIRHRVRGIVMDPATAEKGRDVMIGRDPLAYANRAALERDLAHLATAVARAEPMEAFMTAPSPGILTRFVINDYYPTEDAYLEALGNLMKTEYEAIVHAGFILQIDCPDLGSARNNQHRDKTDDEFRRIAERNVEVLNHAIRDLPTDRMRVHVCWGNYEGPHNHDIPLAKIIDICFKARPMALSFEGANPRHEHEWEDLQQIRIPDDKILIPGVIDSTTNFVEHPRLVAQRICRYAEIVGKERVLAGVDCGFGTNAFSPTVVPSVVWSKLKALAEGAQIATQRLWR
jgi:5-methyltetrahydropteroyltriglutamate--homocysteine methyltransferase